MADGRRYSFDDAKNRRARELEEALEEQRQVLRNEAHARAADIQRTGAEQVAAIQSAGADRASQVHWVATEQHERLATSAKEQTAELQFAANEQRTAMDRAAKAKASELSNLRAVESEAMEQVVAAARERIKQTAANEARRMAERAAASHDEMRKVAAKEAVAFEETTRERLVEAEDALRAQATQTRYDVQRAVEENAEAFEKAAGARVGELQDAVREHSELLDELTRLHAMTTEQIDEVRALVVELRDAQERQPDLTETVEQHVRAALEGLAPAGDGATFVSAPGSTPDLRGLDHEGRVVGVETITEERFAAAQRALEERLADLEAEVAESGAFGGGVAPGEPASAQLVEEFEERLRAAADEQARRLEEAGLVTKRQLLDALAQAEDRLAQSADGRAGDLGEMIVAARTTIERAANSRVESLETTAVELRDGIEELQSDIAAALTQTGEAQSAALDRAARDWLKRMENGANGNGRRNGKLKRRAAPGAAAVVMAIVAALGGTLLVRGGGSGKSSVASANPAQRAAPAKHVPSGDASQVGQVADALSRITWPSTTTAPLSWRAPTTGSAPAPNTTPAPGPSTGAAAPTDGGQTAPAPTQPPPPPPPPPTQPPSPTLLPPITLRLP